MPIFNVRTRAPTRRFTLGSVILWLGLIALILLGGCQSQPKPWRLTDISGHMPNLAFSLTNDEGKPVTAADYRGKVTLLYFGYTHCPDVCPLTLAQLHVVMQQLGPVADQVRILFVSVDPAARHARDNARLRSSTPSTRARVGLSGSNATVEALAKRYRSAFTREPPRGDGAYEVSHSSAIYVFDQKGRARLLVTPSYKQPDLVHDLHLLINTGASTWFSVA